MKRPVGRPNGGTGCKICGEPRIGNYTMRLCLVHAKEYWRMAQRKHRGWQESRLSEPKGGRRKTQCRMCGAPRQVEQYALCLACLKSYRRAGERKCRGWPESRLMDPSTVIRNSNCATCGGPRYSGPDVEMRRRARCLSCLRKDQRAANQRSKVKQEKERMI